MHAPTSTRKDKPKHQFQPKHGGKQGAHGNATNLKKIVLAGNPNVGKSVIFNALTGADADVSNYPGTTIDIARGHLGEDELADTPGVYGVSSFNDEEKAARRMILEADIVINVVSAITLERDLFLTLQLIEMGKKMFVVINQWDDALQRGIKIDVEALSEELGLKILTCVAVKGEGIDAIRANLAEARSGKTRPELMELLAPLMADSPDSSRASGEGGRNIDLKSGIKGVKGVSQAEALLIAEGDALTAEKCGLTPLNERPAIYSFRRTYVNELVERVVHETSQGKTFSTALGRTLLHPFWGSIISFAVCYFIFYQVLGVWIAGNLVDITEKQTMKRYYEPVVRRIAANVFPATITVNDVNYDFPQGTLAAPKVSAALDNAIKKVKGDEIDFNFWSHKNLLGALGNTIVGEYGLATLTVTYLLGLLMPLVIGFYLGLSLLEDSGYLPRLAVLVDRMMNKIGLNGRAIIPLILGLGCVTMATITTRLLTSRREKIIATALLGVAIPCSAQLGVVSGTLARAGGLSAWAVYSVVVGGILALTGLLLNMVLPGQSTGLMIDLPPMRLPRLDNVLRKTWKKSWNFLTDATPMFFLAGFIVTLAQMAGLLDLFIHVLQPIVVNWLQLPNDPRIPTTFILGIVRRDFASFGLVDVGMTPVQAVTAMIVITLFVPCIATVGVMIKERGPKIALTIWFGSWLAAFVIGGLLARMLPFVFSLMGVH
ncbi:MAG: ferrous iron transport protein B [Cyanobacteria bacterium REEB67]|nr:ferrous iron transport protein B [Cyanobacteria bacterium REEB67]